MNTAGYRIVGRLLWHGGKWYVRRRYLSRLPSARKSAVVAAALLAALTALVLIARRG